MRDVAVSTLRNAGLFPSHHDWIDRGGRADGGVGAGFFWFERIIKRPNAQVTAGFAPPRSA
jgi:hypothetical protein